MKDLFEFYEEQPKELAEIVDRWQEKTAEEGLNYEDCHNYKMEVEAIGYTFDYGLDAEPIDLRKMDHKTESHEV